MTNKRPIRVGLMGFGQIGRQIYDLAACSDDVEIPVISDIGDPDILHYLLCSEVEDATEYSIDGNYLYCPRFKTRMLRIDTPVEMPWDAFDVDMVIDATGIYSEAEDMEDHLDNGAKRVLLRTLPVDGADRIIVPGVNDEDADVDDRMISGASATTSALALFLKAVSEKYEVECVSMTSIHAYTSDQALQDFAGSDFRRSRSAAENIIPNTHEAGRWLGEILPAFEDKVFTSALNVPIHEGCLLDVNLVMADSSVTAEDINAVMRDAADAAPGVVGVVEDPIVSSDVIGSSLSLLFDTKGTIKAGDTIIKALGWYESRGHAARLLDIVRLYAKLEG